MLSQQAMCYNVRAKGAKRPTPIPTFSSNFYVAPTRRRNVRRAVTITAGAPQVATRGVEKILGDFQGFAGVSVRTKRAIPWHPQTGVYKGGPGELTFAGRYHVPCRR